MKRLTFMIISAAFIFAIKAHAYDDHDFQVWNTDVEEFKVTKDLAMALEEEFRWADNASELSYQHYDLGLSYNLNKYLSVGGGYRQVYERKSAKFKEENEPYLTATLFWDLLGFKFDDRSRMEYRHFDYQSDSWRYRNKFTVKFPWKFTPLEKLSNILPHFLMGLTKMEIRPYLSDEVLIGFGKIAQLNQNRFSAGLAMNIAKNIKAELYYMLQSTKSQDKWLDANVLGTKLKITF